jgi:hypothetical protein
VGTGEEGEGCCQLIVGRGWEELPVRFEEGLGAWVGGWVREGGKGVMGLTSDDEGCAKEEVVDVVG